MNIQSGYYPVIIIPSVIAKYCASNPLPIFKNINDSARLPPVPSPPEPPLINKSSYVRILQLWGCGLFVLLVTNWVLGFYLINLLLAVGFELSVAGIAMFIVYQNNHQQQIVYQQQMDYYYQRLIEYESQQAELEVKLQRRQTQLQSKQAQLYKKQILWRQQRLRSLLVDRVMQPSSQKGVATEGASEKLFYSQSQCYFPIVQSVVFIRPDNSYNYTADFIIYHELSGLAIDIEIDEPYVLNSGKPHHCIDDDTDKRRNQFFINNNWAVIRFSERQAVLQPYSCFKTIATLIYEITGDDSYLEDLRQYPDLDFHKQWTIRESDQLAKRNYREYYLPAVGTFSSANKQQYHTKTKATKKTKRKRPA